MPVSTSSVSPLHVTRNGALRHHDHFAERLARLQNPVRLLDLVEGQHAVDDRVDPPAEGGLEHGEEVPAVAHRRAEDLAVALIDLADVEVGVRAGGGAAAD